ncbi:MAG: hypothetical protein M1826_001443 [Phylliscum demangeonii]|nr:MAG: hypothetical protein M1826_001443 [Phylliscum demangeonii]
MENSLPLFAPIHDLYSRSTPPNPNTIARPPVYKAVGITLAIAAGVFIGTSFVIKKIGLLKANVKYNEEAGEGYGYLKNAWWWTGMTLMIMGELCNFAAYAFVDAILVTPLGALSVVITTVLSAIFLKERLSFVGKVACFICIVGSVVIVINAPAQSSAATIQQMQHFVIAPGFLSYTGVVIAGSTFTALWAGPRYGKKSMLVYLGICSFIGGLSVVATQGLGAAIVAQASGIPQFNQWFLYVLLVFVVGTLVTEIIYLNKALNLFNAALVTPTYYVIFTSATIVTSAILFRGFKGTLSSISTVVMGFLQICSGVVLLQLSKSAKDVPDAAVFSGDLDQVRTVAEQAQSEFEPKADAIRGAAALVRRFSVSRQKMEAEEGRRLHEEQMRDLEPIGEHEQFEWDGLRRRRTQSIGSGSLHRRKTVHPPLGMSRFAAEEEEGASAPRPRREAGADDAGDDAGGVLGSIRRTARNAWYPGRARSDAGDTVSSRGSTPTVRLSNLSVRAPPGEGRPGSAPAWDGVEPDRHRSPLGYHSTNDPPSYEHRAVHLLDDPHARRHPPVRWADDVGPDPAAPSATPPPPPPPPHAAKRQFSFQKAFQRPRDSSGHDGAGDHLPRPRSRAGLGSRQGSQTRAAGAGFKGATEEERLGLVHGDSSTAAPPRESDDDDDDDDDWRASRPPLSGAGEEKEPVKEAPAVAVPDADGGRWSDGSSSDGSRSSRGRPSHPRPDGERRTTKEWESGASGPAAFL